jgi:peptidoglycan/LPS O-acetylase OafA/YrhL
MNLNATQHDKSLDGVRGLAALTVVFAHFVTAFFPFLRHSENSALFPIPAGVDGLYRIGTFPVFTFLYNGHFSVLVFFILSGYVMALPFYGGNLDALKLRLWGRYIRLNFPIVCVIGIAYAVYALGLYYNVQASAISGSAWLKPFYAPDKTWIDALKSASYASIVEGDGTFLPPLWTLRIEFIGSMLLLLFYAIVPRGRTVLCGLCACLLLFFYYKSESIFFIAMYIGSLLPRVSIERKHAYPLLALALFFGAYNAEYLAYQLLPDMQFDSFVIFQKKSFYNALGALCLVCAVLSGCGRALLESRPVQFLATISYSLYLLHFIVLCSLASFLYQLLGPSKLNIALIFAVYIGVSVALAAAFARWVDQPSIGLSRRFSRWLFRPSPAPLTSG